MRRRKAPPALETATVKSSRVEAEPVKLSRQGLRSEAALSGPRSEILTRFNAVNTRPSGAEQHVDLNATDIKAARSETVGRQNGIIDALQTALNSLAETNAIKDMRGSKEMKRVG